MALLAIEVLATLATLLIAVLLINRFGYRRKRDLKGCREPPRYNHKDPIFGFDLFLKTGKQYEENRYLPELTKMFERYGDTFEAINVGERNIFTIEPENLRAIFTTEAHIWGVQPIRLGPMEPFCGRGFLTVDGDLWHSSRKLFQPSFEKQSIANFSPLERSFNSCISDDLGTGKTRDMQPLLSSMFISATTEFLFGESIDDLSPSAGSDVGKAFDEAMFGSGMRIALGPLGFLAKSKKWLSACQTTRSFAEKYVQRALEYSSVQSKEHLSSDEKKRVLLYNLADHVKDTDRLRNDILQAFFVSQGTTANCVSNVLFLVARQDGMWHELRQEVLRVLPASGLPTHSMIQNLAMLRQVVDEALRVYPILPQNNRVALADTVLPKGGGLDGQSPIYVQAGTMVCVSYYTLHRQKKRWGEDSEEFVPHRWNTFEGKRPYEYLPFGAGPRQCIGREKALAEALYVLARLLHRFARIESRDQRDWQGRVQLSAQNLHGCQVAFFDA